MSEETSSSGDSERECNSVVEDPPIALTDQTAENASSVPPVADGAKTRNNLKASVTTILGSSFFERYFYYSFATILTLYLSDVLKYEEDQATTFYHNFIQTCCTFSVVAAILADSLSDKFRTLIRFNVIYIAGAVLLLVASIPNTIPQLFWSQWSIFIISVGCGGIRPCVPAFGGDQFVRPAQDKLLERFFSVLHYGGTISALIATIVAPLLRAIPCYDEKFCFSLAFGVQGVCLVLSFCIFLIGIKFYNIHPNQGKFTKKTIKCIFHALWRKVKSKGEKKDHWLDYAEDKFERPFIDDVKKLLRILVVLLPAPVYWALFEQQGSRWIFQASSMNGLLGSITIEPDQMLILGPTIVLIVAPILERKIFPLFGTKLTPLRKMSIGGFLASVAFVLAGVVELQIEPTHAKIPHEGYTTFNFVNTLPCSIHINYTGHDNGEITINATGFAFERDLSDEPLHLTVRLVDEECLNLGVAQWSGVIQGESTKEYSVVITSPAGSLEVVRMENEDPIKKLRSGRPRLAFIVDWDEFPMTNASIVVKSDDGRGYRFLINATGSLDEVVQLEDQDVEHGRYDVFLVFKNGSEDVGQIKFELIGQITAEQGASYVVLFQRRFSQDVFLPVEVTPASTVHMLWLIPQFFVLTVAEIMFSITGMHFTFIESPVRMRTFLQASWLFTGSIGNVIVIAIAESHVMPTQAIEFFFYAGLMAADLILFIILAVRYTYISNSQKIRDPMPSIRR